MELAGVIKAFMITIFVAMILLWGLIPFTAIAQAPTVPTQIKVAAGNDATSCRSALDSALFYPLLPYPTISLQLPAGNGEKIVCALLYTQDGSPISTFFRTKSVTLTGQTPVSTPTPTISTPTPTLTPTATPVTTNCVCQSDGFCSAACTFERHATGVSYNSQIKCRPQNNTIYGGNNPAPDNFCRRNLRTKGDADGISGVDVLDYVYWLRASRGARIPPSVNPDFNGDGLINETDQDIWKRFLP